MPPVGRFSHKRSPGSLETSITLQDGCFGVATLMRITALFVPSSAPQDETPPANALETLPTATDGFSPRRAAGLSKSVQRGGLEAAGSPLCSTIAEEEGGLEGRNLETDMRETDTGSGLGSGGDDPQGALRKATVIAEAAAAEIGAQEGGSLIEGASDAGLGLGGPGGGPGDEAGEKCSQGGEPEMLQPIDKSDRSFSSKLDCLGCTVSNEALCPKFPRNTTKTP